MSGDSVFVLSSDVGNYIRLGGKRYSYFAGNNYLGLANHAALKKAAVAAIRRYGMNVAASRETTGTSELHLQLEKAISDFKHREETAIFASGYLGNKILLGALEGEYSAVFADEAAHPSVRDGIPGTVSKVYAYKHCDVDHLASLLAKMRDYAPLIITDGIFALTGEIAPLEDICHIGKTYNALIVVDDAHATGVLGEHGRGTPEHFNLEGTPALFQTETMSKALGVYGGFISSSAAIIDRVRKKSAAYVGSTALPPPLVAAGCAALQIIGRHPELRSRLFAHLRYLRQSILDLGFTTTDDSTPILPIFYDSEEGAVSLSRYLREHHIIAPSINYPVKMDKFILRITVSATHTQHQIDELIDRLKEWRDCHASSQNKKSSH